MAFYGHTMCQIWCNHENRSFLVKCPLLKKWHFLDLVCAEKSELTKKLEKLGPVDNRPSTEKLHHIVLKKYM